jgi:hypothetical protein
MAEKNVGNLEKERMDLVSGMQRWRDTDEMGLCSGVPKTKRLSRERYGMHTQFTLSA